MPPDKKPPKRKGRRRFAKVAAESTDDIIEPPDDLGDNDVTDQSQPSIASIAGYVMSAIWGLLFATALFVIGASSLGLGFGTARPNFDEAKKESTSNTAPPPTDMARPPSSAAPLYSTESPLAARQKNSMQTGQVQAPAPSLQFISPKMPMSPPPPHVTTAAAALSPPPPPEAPPELDVYVSMLRAPFLDARNICEREGGVLAAPQSTESNNKLSAELRNHIDHADRMWIGITDTQEEGHWARREHKGDSVSLSYVNWAPGQPDGQGREDCVEMWTTGQWNDAPCGDAKVYACEVPQPPIDGYTFECSPGIKKQLEGAPGGAPSRCEFRILGADGHRPSNDKREFGRCRELCEAQDSVGRLAEPRTAEQRQYLARHIRHSGDDSMWVGLTPVRPDGRLPGSDGWRWLADVVELPGTEAGWAHGQPDNDGLCAEMWGDATWNDRPCEGDPFAFKVCPCEVPVRST